jgi:hypothetical protein
VYYPDDVLELGRPILAGGAVPVEMLWLLEDANVAFFLLGGGRGRVGGWEGGESTQIFIIDDQGRKRGQYTKTRRISY